MISPDREVQPELWAVEKVHQNVTIDSVDLKPSGHGTVKVTNGFFFTNLGSFESRWELLENGEVVRHGKLPRLDVAPGDSREVRVPYGRIRRHGTSEHHVTVKFVLPEDTRWAPKGHVVAVEQFPLAGSTPPKQPTRGTHRMPPPRLEESDQRATLHGAGFTVNFSKKRGVVTSYTYRNKKLFENGPAPHFWRASTDNDRGSGYAGEIATWRDAGNERAIDTVDVTRKGRSEVRVEVRSTLPTSPSVSHHTTMLTVYGSGEVTVRDTLEPGKDLPDIPLVGTRLTVPDGFETMEWYGRGPHENYTDRQNGAFVGRYESTVDDRFTPYLECQETGNLTDVRWITLTDGRGFGLLAGGNPLLEARALHYTTEDLDESKHPYELTRTATELALNYQQMGVGDNSFVPAGRPQPEYRLHAGKSYSYEFTLRPQHPGRGDRP